MLDNQGLPMRSTEPALAALDQIIARCRDSSDEECLTEVNLRPIRMDGR